MAYDLVTRLICLMFYLYFHCTSFLTRIFDFYEHAVVKKITSFI